jgi:AI-2 transport protein TqsA
VTERVHPRTLSVLVGLAALTIALAGIRGISGILGPAVLALVLIITVYPLRIWLVNHKVPGTIASLILLLSVYLLLILVTLALVISVGRLAVLVPDYNSQINGYIDDVAGWLRDLGVLTDLFFIATLLLFLAFDAAPTMKIIGGLADRKPDLVTALATFAAGTRSYMAVSAGFGFVVAVVDVGALLIMGVPGAFVWGVLAFVTNFIPNVGFVLGVVPPALIALLDGGPSEMIAVILIYAVINFVIQSVIQPRIVGDKVGLSATLTFLSLVFWGWAIGALGALLAVPLSLLLRAILVDADPSARWMLPLISGKPSEAD